MRSNKLSPCGLLKGNIYNHFFDLRIDTVFEYGLFPADLTKSRLTTGIIEFFESIKTIPGIAGCRGCGVCNHVLYITGQSQIPVVTLQGAV